MLPHNLQHVVSNQRVILIRSLKPVTGHMLPCVVNRPFFFCSSWSCLGLFTTTTMSLSGCVPCSKPWSSHYSVYTHLDSGPSLCAYRIQNRQLHAKTTCLASDVTLSTSCMRELEPHQLNLSILWTSRALTWSQLER